MPLIGNPGKIWLMVEPVDMRRGIDGLSVLVEQALQRSPCAGSAFVFCNRAGNRIKVLLWDGTGVWLCQRRLHQGRFVWGCNFAQENIAESQYRRRFQWFSWYRKPPPVLSAFLPILSVLPT